MRRVTPHTRLVLILSSVISSAFLLTLVLMLNNSREPINWKSRVPWALAIMAGLAVVSPFAVLWVRTRRDRHTAQLEAKYYEAYEAVSDWLQVSTLSVSERREVLKDILELLFHAQVTDRPASDVVGVEIGAFVQRVQQSFGYRSSLLFRLLGGAQYLGWLLPFLQFFTWMERPGTVSFFDATLGIALIIYLAVLAIAILPLTRTAIARHTVVPAFALPLGLGVAFIALSELSRHFLWHLSWVRALLDGETHLIGSWSSALIWAVAVALIAVVQQILRRHSLRSL